MKGLGEVLEWNGGGNDRCHLDSGQGEGLATDQEMSEYDGMARRGSESGNRLVEGEAPIIESMRALWTAAPGG